MTKNYQIKVEYSPFDGDIYKAIVTLYLPSCGGVIHPEYRSDTTELMSCHLQPDWGYRSDEKEGFKRRFLSLRSPTKARLEEQIADEISRIETCLHKVYLENTRAPDPVEYSIDPSVDPAADVVVKDEVEDEASPPIFDSTTLVESSRLDDWRDRLKAGDWVRIWLDKHMLMQTYRIVSVMPSDFIPERYVCLELRGESDKIFRVRQEAIFPANR